MLCKCSENVRYLYHEKKPGYYFCSKGKYDNITKFYVNEVAKSIFVHYSYPSQQLHVQS